MQLPTGSFFPRPMTLSWCVHLTSFTSPASVKGLPSIVSIIPEHLNPFCGKLQFHGRCLPGEPQSCSWCYWFFLDRVVATVPKIFERLVLFLPHESCRLVYVLQSVKCSETHHIIAETPICCCVGGIIPECIFFAVDDLFQGSFWQKELEKYFIRDIMEQFLFGFLSEYRLVLY